MTIRLSASRIFRWHLIAIVLFGILNLLVLFGDALGYHGMLGFSALFRLSGEGNAPSAFSALALVAAALAAARNTQAGALREGERAGWRIFAILLTFMAIDEAIQIHEIMRAVGARLSAVSPWLAFSIYPYGLVALGLAVFLFRFWMRQSRAVMVGIALGGICYVVAAVGLELVEDRMFAAGIGNYDTRMGAAAAVEELGEMVAVALFLRAFLVRFGELGGGAFLSLVGARPILGIEIAPALQPGEPPKPVAVEGDA